MDKPKKPRVPPERAATVRQEMLYLLEGIMGGGGMGARELALSLRIPERDVVEHLEHLRKSLSGTGRHLVVIPAECRKCGFVFAKRDRLGKPGKCPVCKSGSIMEPGFRVE